MAAARCIGFVGLGNMGSGISSALGVAEIGHHITTPHCRHGGEPGDENGKIHQQGQRNISHVKAITHLQLISTSHSERGS